MFERARYVTCNAAVVGREDDCSDAFIDVEVMEEIRVLVEEGVGWVCGEVDCAAVSISTGSQSRTRVLLALDNWRGWSYCETRNCSLLLRRAKVGMRRVCAASAWRPHETIRTQMALGNVRMSKVYWRTENEALI